MNDEIDLIQLLVMLELMAEMTPKQMYSNAEYIRIAALAAIKHIIDTERNSKHGI